MAERRQRSNLLRCVGRRLDAFAFVTSLLYRCSSGRARVAIGAPASTNVRCRRGEWAMEMLQCIDLPLAEIAYRCSFGSQAHFTTCLKQQFGATPGEARRER